MDTGSGGNAQRALKAALYRVLKALARLCLRNGVPFDAFGDLSKAAFLDVAYREFTIPGRKQSASRVSVLTGIHRKEIARIRASSRYEDPVSAARIARCAAIITGWRRGAVFSDERGQPARLVFEDGPRSFAELVRRFGGGDIPPRAALDELVRVGAVTRARDGRIRLVADAYVPSDADTEGAAMFGRDVSDLITVIDRNLAIKPKLGLFQRIVAYDNLSEEALANIRRRIERDGQTLLEKIDRTMARHDRDANPKATGTGRKRAVLGLYYLEDDVKEE